MQYGFGNHGFCWSSTLNPGNDYHRGMHLDFNARYLKTDAANARASGLQLRCLSE
ncbi:hypothetical protein [uncultured Rikenella sp.]|uniref:hypothetical protein n=1 Tax=uncultured Rikenella sp. TaxID=368003 RepID=UPI00260A6071|nr:hypothetical protein [uncultured Rikenella sp.]